ncbi:MAG: ACP S-malonyltransferase, partial [Gemmatimonadota bacterium]
MTTSDEGTAGIALLLPGQGSQHVGMGSDLAEAFPEAADVFRRAEDALGIPLRRLCWEGPAEDLTRTENAQPAILTHSYAVWRVLPASFRRRVVVAAGHSLGEFTAYLVAGSLQLVDALRLVRRRGELMARSAGEGTMAAVLGLDDEAVRDACRRVEDGVVVPANFNAPGQVVISGTSAAVERAGEAALEMGARRVVSLDVSGAFHSPLMRVAHTGLEAALEDIPLERPAFPVVANASAEAVTDPDRARSLLLRQLTSPVRWTEGVARMTA